MRENSWCPLIKDFCKGKPCVCYDGPMFPSGAAYCDYFKIDIASQEPEAAASTQGTER